MIPRALITELLAPGPLSVRPLSLRPPVSASWLPSSQTPGAPPLACVVASMVTVSVMSGRSVPGVMTQGAVPAMLKSMTSAPALALAFVIASRRLPAPVSAIVVTVKDAARTTAGCQDVTDPTTARLPISETRRSRRR